MLVSVAACAPGRASARLDGATVTFSNADPGAAAAAIDAMDADYGDPAPDTVLHDEVTPVAVASAEDSARADVLLVAMRGALRRYTDMQLAAADGFEELPSPMGKRTIHQLTNWSWARDEATRFDATKPTALIYREGADGAMSLLGALYTAPANATATELNARIPTGLARWHRHVNWCAPKDEHGRAWLTSQDGHAKYGPHSPTATSAACAAAGGAFYAHVFGWMVHVTLNGSDDPAMVWGGGLPRGDSTVLATQTGDTATLRLPRTPAPRLAPERRPPATPTTMLNPPVTEPSPSPRLSPPPATTPLTTATTDGASNGAQIQGTLFSGNHTVAYERYRPSGPGPFPAILLLHGENGLPPQSEWFERMGKALADHGYVVEVLHYFDRTGTIAAGPGERLINFRPWMGAVHDGLSDLAQTSGVDRARLGIIGVGLGGTLALATGAQDTRIGAIVEFGGSLPAWAAPTIHHIPPVLIAQTEDDPNPNASRDADRVRALCNATNADCEMDVFPKVGRAEGGRNQHERSNFRQRSVQFLDRYLKEQR